MGINTSKSRILSNNNRFSFWQRTLALFLCFVYIISFVISPRTSYAQTFTPVSAGGWTLPQPGATLPISESFLPPLLKGVTIDPQNPLNLDFLVDHGQDHLSSEQFKKESQKLVNYFMAALTVPESELWVNLSPAYAEKDRIVPQHFGHTELGRDLLAQDYLLKQLTASLMSPEGDLGKKFWERIHEKILKDLETKPAKSDSLGKLGEVSPFITDEWRIWIVPRSAVVYEHEGTAFVVESKLKVMLEEEYLASTAVIPAHAGIQAQNDPLMDPSQESLLGHLQHAGMTKENYESTTQTLKEVLLPEIEKEVNEGKTFAPLRQITMPLSSPLGTNKH